MTVTYLLAIAVCMPGSLMLQTNQLTSKSSPHPNRSVVEYKNVVAFMSPRPFSKYEGNEEEEYDDKIDGIDDEIRNFWRVSE